MNDNTTQLAVRINVFGFPTIHHETDVKSFGDDLFRTKRVIDSDDYDGNGVHIKTDTVFS